MRFGWGMATVAVLLLAGQASAATFIGYEARGTGTLSYNDASDPRTRTGDLVFDFSLEVDPGYMNVDDSIGTGSYYLEIRPGSTYLATLVRPGTLRLLYNFDFAASESLSATIMFADTSYTFPKTTGTFAASGPLNYQYSSGSALQDQYTITGTLSSLSVLGQVSGFQMPSVSISPSSVPDMPTWAMMIVGFGLVGSTMRRKVAVSFA